MELSLLSFFPSPPPETSQRVDRMQLIMAGVWPAWQGAFPYANGQPWQISVLIWSGKLYPLFLGKRNICSQQQCPSSLQGCIKRLIVWLNLLQAKRKRHLAEFGPHKSWSFHLVVGDFIKDKHLQSSQTLLEEMMFGLNTGIPGGTRADLLTTEIIQSSRFLSNEEKKLGI